MEKTREKEIEALVNGILTQCKNKGFSMSETETVCRKLREAFNSSYSLQVRETKFEFTQSSNRCFNADCSSAEE